MLEEKIEALIAALEQNTNALLAATGGGKPETVKGSDKKGGKKGGKGKAKATAKPKATTVESVKALAKKIALATDDPKECMEQIREVVGTTAEACYEDANVGLDQFDETGLVLLEEALKAFKYEAPGGEDTEADNLEI